MCCTIHVRIGCVYHPTPWPLPRGGGTPISPTSQSITRIVGAREPLAPAQKNVKECFRLGVAALPPHPTENDRVSARRSPAHIP